MNVSEVDICNLALSYVGGKAGFMAFTDKQIEASKCKLLYPMQRDIVMAAVDWPFARKTRSLALKANVELMEWTYCYAVPGDCVVTRYLVRDRRTDPPIPFIVARDPTPIEDMSITPGAGGSAQSSAIFTDRANAKLVYTSHVVDPAFFHPLFVEALAWKLAMSLVSPLGLPIDRQSFANARYVEALSSAHTSAANQEYDAINDREPDWIAAR